MSYQHLPFPSQLGGLPVVNNHGSSAVNARDLSTSTAIVPISTGTSRSFSDSVSSPERLQINDPSKRRKPDDQSLNHHSSSASAATASTTTTTTHSTCSVDSFLQICGIQLNNDQHSASASASSASTSTSLPKLTLEQRKESIDAVITAEMDDFTKQLERLRAADITVSKLQHHYDNGTLPHHLRIKFEFGNPLPEDVYGLDELKARMQAQHDDYLRCQLENLINGAKRDQQHKFDQLKRFNVEEMIVTAFDTQDGSLLNTSELRREALDLYLQRRQETAVQCARLFAVRDAKYQCRIAEKLAKQTAKLKARTATSDTPISPDVSQSLGDTTSRASTNTTVPVTQVPVSEERIKELMEQTFASQFKKFMDDQHKERTSKMKNKKQKVVKQSSKQPSQHYTTPKSSPVVGSNKASSSRPRSYLDAAKSVKPPPDKQKGRSVSVVENKSSSNDARGKQSKTSKSPHFQQGSPRQLPKHKGGNGGDRGKQSRRE